MQDLEWLEGGGLYYKKYPAAKLMDGAKKKGTFVDYKAALEDVDKASKAE